MTITTILPQTGIACTAMTAPAIATSYRVKAKRNAPITREEADIIWKLHPLRKP